MRDHAFGAEDPYSVNFNGEGGVRGSTTESSRANNAAAEETESSIEDSLRHGYSDQTPDDTQNHAYG